MRSHDEGRSSEAAGRHGSRGAQRPDRPVEPAAILARFCISPEFSRLEPAERELFWASELLGAMSCAGWTWNDLDLAGLAAALFDGLPWTIERAPADPAALTRQLDAFLRFAGREYGAPHAAICSAYLRSARAVAEVREWVRPARDAPPGEPW